MMKEKRRFCSIIFLSALLLIIAAPVWAADSSSTAANWAFVSAALVMGMSVIGAAIAVAHIGSAAVGAMSEKPEIGMKPILYVGLAEGLAVFGFFVAYLILAKV